MYPVNIVSAATNTMFFIINDNLTHNFPLHFLSDISVCTAKNDISGCSNRKHCDQSCSVPLIASDAKFKLKLT